MKLTPITALAALVLIGTGGFMIGRISSAGSTSSPAAKESLEANRLTRSSGRDLASLSEVKTASRGSRTAPADKLTAQDRLDRLDAILKGENPLDRNRAMLAFIDQLAPGDFEAAVAHLRSLGIQDERRGEYALLLGAWAQVDPTAALAYARENIKNNFAFNTILTTWASNDPEAAIQWAKANFTGEGANPYLPGIIRALADSDPTRAYELLSSMPRSNERAEGLDFMLPHIIRQGADATRKWIASIEDDSLREGAILRSAEDLAALDPAGTVSFLINNPGQASDRRLDNVFSVWGRENLSEALSTFEALPAGNTRSLALSGLIGSVTVNDPKAGLALMEKNSADLNDNVVQRFIWHSFGSNPEIAASQIARIAEPGARDRMYRRALESWMEDDAASAQTWIQANNVPDSVKQYLAGNQANKR